MVHLLRPRPGNAADLDEYRLVLDTAVVDRVLDEGQDPEDCGYGETGDVLVTRLLLGRIAD